MFQTFCVPLEGVTGGDADLQTHDVEPKIVKISPTAGVWDANPSSKSSCWGKRRAKVKAAYADGGAEIAAQLIYRDLMLTNDEIIAMWTQLPSNICNQSKKFKDQFTREEAA